MGFSESKRAFVQVAREATPGVLPGSPVVRALGYNSITGFLPTVEMVARDPISPSNQRQAGQPVDKLANGTIQLDLTISNLRELIEPTLQAAFTGPAPNLATSATSAHFVVPTMAGALPARTLVYVRGCLNAANNGLKQVDAGSTTTQIVIVGGLTVETGMAARGVTVAVCGFRFASEDASITVSGGVTTLVTVAKNLTQLALLAGQTVVFGSVPGTATNINRFAQATNRGPVRIASTPTANAMVIENMTAPFVAEAGTGGGKEIDLLYGEECRIRYLTDASYAEPTTMVEVTLHKLGAADAPAYLYTTACKVASNVIALPEKSKGTQAINVVGRDVTGPTVSRTSGFSAAFPLWMNQMVNTTSNIVRGRIRKVNGGALRTGYITAVTLTLESQTERNGAHGVMGAVDITQGKIMATAEVTAYFTVPEVIADLVAGELMSWDYFIANNDGAFMFDMPQCQLASGEAEYDPNKSVKIGLQVPSSEDPIFGTSFIASFFPYMPLT